MAKAHRQGRVFRFTQPTVRFGIRQDATPKATRQTRLSPMAPAAAAFEMGAAQDLESIHNQIAGFDSVTHADYVLNELMGAWRSSRNAAVFRGR